MTTLIITFYILSIFLNRYLNKLAIKYGASLIPILWFIPIIPALGLILGILTNGNALEDWFEEKK